MENILFFGFVIFFSVLSIQIFIWKFFYIKKEIFLLLLLYIFLPIVINITLVFLEHIAIVDFCLLFLFTFFISLAFLQTYPALKEDIPSIKIVFLIERNKKIKFQDLIDRLNSNLNIIQRRHLDLNDDHLIVKQNKKYRLTYAGLLIAIFFNFYRKMLGNKRLNG